MSEAGTIYEVSLRHQEPSGQIIWQVLLRTTDPEEANELLTMLKGDPEARAKMRVIPPGMEGKV